MGHNISERKYRARLLEFAGAEIAAEERRQAKDIVHARRVVELWNKRTAMKRPVSYWPTVGTALAARTPWLQIECSACRTIGEVDLRTIDVHPAAPICALIRRFKCRRCPAAPFPRLLELTAHELTPHYRPAYVPPRR